MSKRAVICVKQPHLIIPQLSDYSVMIVNPDATESRLKYLLDNSDYSLLVTESGEQWRDGGDYVNERVLQYTSGTTGDSKFCAFTQKQLDYASDQLISAFSLTANDRYTGVMPLWSGHGQGFYWATERAKCERNFLSIKEVRSIARYHPTCLTAVPHILKLFLNCDLDNLRFIRSGGAPLPYTLHQALEQKFKTAVLETCGFTEALSLGFCNRISQNVPGTVGLPVGIEARIDQGHLEIRGPSLFVDGWYDTGDLAEQDSAGNFKLTGRSRDQINIKGVKINPLSLESHLIKNCNEIGEVVVFGTDSVKCMYTGSSEPIEVRKVLVTLGQYCWPTAILQVDQIPLSPGGKVSRHFLNMLY
jgi:acyl-CoA synthetase (AMP-forming)/AMP-acid ligase II